MQSSESRIKRALAVAHDTKVFEMGEGFLSRVPAVFGDCFPGRMAMVVADVNTWRVAGAQVYQHLLAAGIETGVFLIPDREFHAEWKYVEMVEAAVRGAGAVAVAVGSGVINDLCKLSSAHLGQSYVCVPTAASVDGYSSFGASISYEGVKQTFDCPAPVAIVADISVIAQAPKEMTAAGYADLAAKIPAGAEWMIADLFGTEPIIPEAWHVLQDVLDEMLSDPEGVAAGKPAAIAALFEGLTLSGFAMLQPSRLVHGPSLQPLSGHDASPLPRQVAVPRFPGRDRDADDVRLLRRLLQDGPERDRRGCARGGLADPGAGAGACAETVRGLRGSEAGLQRHHAEIPGPGGSAPGTDAVQVPLAGVARRFLLSRR